MFEPSKPPVTTVPRLSPLAGIITPGLYGARHPGGPGVRLGLRHPLSMATIIARKAKAKALSRTMNEHYGLSCPLPGHSISGKKITVHWAGADQWLAVADGYREGVLFAELCARLAGLASVSDQSHGRIALTVAGPRARHVLAKGTPVDLHPRAFGPGRCAVTQMAHVGVHIAQTGDDEFEVSLFRGFAESFWQWLCEMSLEYGYEVKA